MTNTPVGPTPPWSAPPQQELSPTYSMPPRRRPWLPWVIVGGCIALVGLFALFVIVVVNLIAGARPLAGDALVAGEPGLPIAEEPLECADECFGADNIPFTQPSTGALLALGLDVTTYEWGTFDPMTAGELHRGNIPGWIDMEGYPDSCFFVPGNTPTSFTDSDDSTDEVQYTGTNSSVDKLNTLEQSVRFFQDSASAEAYLSELATNILDCDLVEYGSGQDYYSAEVTPAPLLDLPPSVAAAGWVRTGDVGQRWRSYVIDLQRGNMVVRTRLLTDGSVSEAEYRNLVRTLANQLELLEPTAPAIPEG